MMGFDDTTALLCFALLCFDVAAAAAACLLFVILCVVVGPNQLANALSKYLGASYNSAN
jgi:hypothetical protein